MTQKITSPSFLIYCVFTVFFVIRYTSVHAQSKNENAFDNSNFTATFSGKGISSFISKQDKYAANIISRGGSFGSINCKYRVGDGDWLNIYQDSTERINEPGSKVTFRNDPNGVVLGLERAFETDGKGINMQVTVHNKMNFPVTIGDLSILLPWAKPGGEDPSYIFEKTFTKHQFISGNASFIYFTRASGIPPFLLVTTRPGTRLEYFETANNNYNAFVYSGLSAGRKKEGTWRLPNRMLPLEPTGKPGSSTRFGFRFEWVNSYEELRNALYENGLFDIRVVPGMTVPQGLDATFSLHTKNKIDSIVSEFPYETKLVNMGEKDAAFQFYKVNFRRLGENKLTIYYNGSEQTILEFFSTEPVETLLKKRSAFLTKKQQHHDTTKWYNGLYSIWDMKNKVLRGPDNTDGFDFWWGYVLTCDDIGLSKAPFIASKNVYLPDDTEIASVEYYIRNFVWGGLQRTDKELPNPYGIYGVPNWRESRDPFLSARSRNANLDKMKIYRSYDYPHIIKMYFHMYEIATLYPSKVKYLDAKGYLERAFQTAKAYFTYPYKILPWYETYKWGCYNELTIIPLIDALEKNGRKEDAAWLRNEWEKKVKYFVYDDPYPFRSEYSIDRTAFESSYAFAKYGATYPMKADRNLWYDVNKKKWYSHPRVSMNDSRQFMDRQNEAGLAVRGWVNASYYNLGSDDSEGGGLSYMARMGGWSILDYGLHFAAKPYDWIQLGYASYLSSFALMNTGNASSNYGFWFPGKENDGALGWAFNSQKYGRIWLQDRNNPRGAWNYDGEADLGMGAITHTAATVITNDPLFGWIGYGGNLEISGEELRVIPQDGVRIRFGIITDQTRLMVELSRDLFSATQSIVTNKSGNSFLFKIDNVPGENHTMQLKLTGTEATVYTIRQNGKKIKEVKLKGAIETFVDIKIPVKGCTIELLKLR